jgi:hypothetical protein
MYLDVIVTQYHLLALPPPVGCTNTEIEALEQHFNHTLPDAYREFLQWAGHDASSIFSDLEDYSYAHIPDMQSLARKLIAAYHFPTPLPDDAVVFYFYDSAHFAFFRANDDADPTVYQFVETPSSFTATFTSNNPDIPPVERHIITERRSLRQFIPGGPFSAWLGQYVTDLAQEERE